MILLALVFINPEGIVALRDTRWTHDWPLVCAQFTNGIATSVNNTYFSAVRDAFFDCAEPPNTAWSVLRSHAQRLDVVIKDATRPSLLWYTIDLDAGEVF
jgi:hypothetical protein